MAILLLILASGVLAGAEIAVVTLRASRIAELAHSGQRGSAAIKRLRDDPESLIATVQTGITVIGSTASALGGADVARSLAGVLARSQPLARYADTIALVVVVAAVSFLSLVVGELVPKSLALRSSERYALAIAEPLWALSRIARPIVRFLTATSNAVLSFFGDRTSFTESRLSPDELTSLVQEAASGGALHPKAGEIAARAIELAGLTAGQVMIPRGKVVGLSRHTSVDELREIVLECGHNRMPVFEGTLDNVVGYISVKDILNLAWEGRLFVLEDLVRPAHFAPELMPAIDLLQEMRQKRSQLAIIVDEQGGVSGIVTLEDLLEELVGEIASERDERAPEPIVRQRDGSAMVAGDTPVRDVNRAMGIELPESRKWSTVAGLCMALIGRMPRAGDCVRGADGTVVTIVEATDRRVVTVRVAPKQARES